MQSFVFLQDISNFAIIELKIIIEVEAMKYSAAAMVKSYLEIYICVNVTKSKQNRYPDRELARSILSVAFHIVEQMNDLIRSNRADDFPAIKDCLKEQTAFIHEALKDKQTTFQSLFTKTKLPRDFGQSVNDAWYHLAHYEKQDELRRNEEALSFSVRRAG